MRSQTVLFSFAMLAAVPLAIADESVKGVWRLTMYQMDYREEPDSRPPPGVMIFTDKHYSAVLPYDDEGMSGYAERWSPTEEERLKRFGELVVNTGSYEIDGSMIVFRPMVAKDPDLIGGRLVFEYERKGAELVLTWVDEYSFDGVQHPLIIEYGGKEHMTFTQLEE